MRRLKVVIFGLLIVGLIKLPVTLQAQQSKLATPETKAPVATTEFAQLVERLSEPSGYFDTDNLISNEASFQHVMGALRKRNVTGGVYIGVGPDTGFTYIAQIKPKLAIITDIRRDNLVQHLWFKALFALSRNRVEYLCQIFGKPFPSDSPQWNNKSIAQVLEYLDKTPKQAALLEQTSAAISDKLKAFGVALNAKELAHVRKIEEEFYNYGLELKFTSKNRSPRSYYPSYRELLLEKDLSGKQCNYLVNEEDFQTVKTLSDQHRIIPVVADLSGTKALPAIVAFLKERNETVSAFYTSNVEFYLVRGYASSSFAQFANNVKALPRNANSVIIRSYFNGSWGDQHPMTVSGYYSTQLLQTMDSFAQEHARGGYRSYNDLIEKHLLELR